MCPFRALMLFLCSIGAVVTGYTVLASFDNADAKEVLLPQSAGTSKRVIQCCGIVILVLIHIDVFLQLGYLKALVHAGLGIVT